MHLEQLGPYRLGTKLGQGGMGAVYEAVDVESGQSAAVKVLSPALAAESGFRVRFEAEIESLKKLKHPNIVRLYGYGEQEGYLYYAMELVDGGSLEDEIRNGRRFDWREVTHLAIKICRALKHAHDHGVIHRDIKPANLLLSADGEVKLSDFGIARLFGNTRLTSDGGVLGTAEYMAPEQADGRSVTDRCDQYSLGGVMYALLAGRPPFRANTLMEMLQMQRYAEPLPVRRFAPDTPDEMERTIAQLLDKDPQNRFANTLLLARALEAMEHGLSISTAHDDFVVDEPRVSNPNLTGFDPFAATLVPPEPVKVFPSQRTDLPEGTLFHTDPSAAIAPLAKPEPPATGHFVKVDELPVAPAQSLREKLRGLVTPQIMLPALGLLLAGLVVWYMLQPKSADRLYAQVMEAAETGDPSILLDADESLNAFLDLYPEDPRSATLRPYQHANELTRGDRRYHHLARVRGQPQELTTEEREYVDAIRLSHTDAEKAVTRLEAFIAVNNDPDATTETAQMCVELARRKLDRLKQQVESQTQEALTLIEARLERADELVDTDPEAARKIWQGVIASYSDKPWAADAVNRANALLGQSPPK